MFQKNSFDGFIGIYENYFDGTFIDSVISHYNKINQFPINQDTNPKHWKDDEQLYYFDPAIIQTLDPYFVNYFLDVMWNKIYPSYAEKFSIINERPVGIDQIKCKKIRPGGGFHQWHYESLGADSRRRLVVQLYLNDIEEGGETEFLYQKKRISARRNKLLIWPADWTHTHRGNPPLGEQDKYILTTWIIETESINNERT